MGSTFVRSVTRLLTPSLQLVATAGTVMAGYGNAPGVRQRSLEREARVRDLTAPKLFVPRAILGTVRDTPVHPSKMNRGALSVRTVVPHLKALEALGHIDGAAWASGRATGAVVLRKIRTKK